LPKYFIAVKSNIFKITYAELAYSAVFSYREGRYDKNDTPKPEYLASVNGDVVMVCPPLAFL